MDDISGIRLFVLAANLGSFTATARNLQVSVASVSRRIGALETQLKVKLFNRGQQSLTLTEAGELLLRRAAPLIEALEGTIEDVSLLEGKPKGILKVRARTIAAGWLVANLPGFLRDNPEVRVDLLASNDEALDLVAHNVDIDIRYTRPDRTDLVARLLAPSKLILAASPAYLARCGTPGNVADLTKHEVIRYATDPDSERWILETRDGTQHDIVPVGRVRVNDGILLRAALRAGLGLAMMPHAEIQAELASGEFVHVLPETDVTVPRIGGEGIFAVYQRSPFPTGKVRAFLAFLDAVFN